MTEVRIARGAVGPRRDHVPRPVRGADVGQGRGLIARGSVHDDTVPIALHVPPDAGISRRVRDGVRSSAGRISPDAGIRRWVRGGVLCGAGRVRQISGGIG